ncbi:MAG TPA: DUF1223 domain-containing protein [Caulobacteraceae bacterium]|nr:DUF1223 domain-containing protein [Caulobacteraceae bacterium]
MKALERLLVVVALGVLPGAIAAPETAWAKGPVKGPVVVELFTAQGCASCKQANRLIARIAGRPGVIALTWSVDYWDYLGWEDTFAQPEFTARQRAYGRRLGPRDVYTPQVVVDGAAQVSGDDADGVEASIRKAEHSHRRQPKIRILAGGRVKVGPASADRGAAEVWLVRYDPHEQDVKVTAGDNRGAVVVHQNVVRQLVRLGTWMGQAKAYKAPAAEEKGLSSVIIVQGVHGGPIFGAADGAARKP